MVLSLNLGQLSGKATGKAIRRNSGQAGATVKAQAAGVKREK